MEKKMRVFQLAVNISLRRENFGGLVFVPSTGEIIQLNSVAYGLFREISHSGQIVSNFQHLKFWQDLVKKNIVREGGIKCLT